MVKLWDAYTLEYGALNEKYPKIEKFYNFQQDRLGARAVGACE